MQEIRLLFNEIDSTWLQKDFASPLDGWSMQSILSTTNVQRAAKNDLNGLLYFHIRSTLEQFCDRIQNPISKTNFVLYCVDAAFVPTVFPMKSHGGFDRIEVSNIADEAYLGLLKTLATFAPLLRERSINLQATLVTLFLNACEIANRQMGNDFDANLQVAQMRRLRRFLPLNPSSPPSTRSAEMMKIMAARDLLRNYDGIFAFYMNATDFKACAKYAGLEMRKRNTVVEAWPMRLKKKPKEKGADEEFQTLMASCCTGAERYVEWVRVQ
ncbi:MAG: hypothetical protein Q9178_004829 [Gyalolechia marmorata]